MAKWKIHPYFNILLVRLTNDGGNDAQPCWSPDGKEILFVSDRDGNHELYLMNADGSNQVNLTHSSSDDNTPFFSPNGSMIAFISDRDGDYDLWIADSNGANPRKLTTDAADHVGWFSWSPDGSRIVFDSQADGYYHVYVVRPDGSGYRQLTQGAFNDRFSSWTCDGSWVVFVSDRDGGDEIYAMDPDGGHQLNLSYDPAYQDELPSPSPVYQEGGGCFIATAAFGSYLDPHVKVLRSFRDRHLLTNPLGRLAVAAYYHTSPPIAAYIARHSLLKMGVRWLLTPIVYGVEYPRIALALMFAPFVPFGFMIRKRLRGRCRASRPCLIPVCNRQGTNSETGGGQSVGSKTAAKVAARKIGLHGLGQILWCAALLISCLHTRAGTGEALSPIFTLDTRSVAPDCPFADDYPLASAPFCPESTPSNQCPDNTKDPWGFFNRECTSYVAWKLNKAAGTTASPYFFTDYISGGHWGNAGNWAANALLLGFRVDNLPEVGAVAQWNAGEPGGGPLGHVGYVEAVNLDGSVNVSEYNYHLDHNFDTRCQLNPPRFLYIQRPQTGPPQFVSQPLDRTAAVGANVAFGVTVIGTAPFNYQWQLNGENIPGATSASLSLNSVGAAASGRYSVVVWNAYGSAVSAAAYLAVYLPPSSSPPPAPVVVQTGRRPTNTETGAGTIPSNPQLKVFAKGVFQGNTPVLGDRITIVLTHGWNAAPDGWPTAMAKLILGSLGSSPPNLVAWDWSDQAKSVEPFVPATKTQGQGRALGQALLQALGPNYAHSIHFIGHSLGTLVNSAAADYLHGDSPGATPQKGAGAFLPANTQMTLFDEAELAPETFNTVLSVLLSQIGAGPAPVRPFYDRPLPQEKAWADNYLSAFGLFHDDAVNVVLTDGLAEVAAARDFPALWAALKDFHRYPMDWYGETVANPSASLMGYQWSFEEGGFGSAPPPDQVFVQSSSGSELDLAKGDLFTEESNYAKRLGALAEGLGYTLVQTVKDGLASIYGSVTTSIEETVTRDPYAMTAGVGALVAGWSPGFTLRTGPGGAGPLGQLGGRQPKGPGQNTPAYFWATVNVPSDALYMSFDFEFEGNGSNDLFAAAVNGTNVLSLETSLLATNALANSGLINVASWAGQTAELFFGIVGGTSTNASVTVQAIRFYQPAAPSLSARSDSTNIVVSWPLWAQGMELQATDHLSGTNTWSAVTNQPAIVNFMNTVTNPVLGTQRFFRLAPAP